MERYGVGSLNHNAIEQPTASSNTDMDDNGSGGISSTLRSAVSSVRNTFGRLWFSSNTNTEDLYRRVVMYRAMAYSTAYFLTQTWFILFVIVGLAGVAQPLALFYLTNIFAPLQGVSYSVKEYQILYILFFTSTLTFLHQIFFIQLFNFLIFIQPKAMSGKRSQGGNLSWCQAIRKVIWTSGTQGKNSTTSNTHDQKPQE